MPARLERIGPRTQSVAELRRDRRSAESGSIGDSSAAGGRRRGGGRRLSRAEGSARRRAASWPLRRPRAIWIGSEGAVSPRGGVVRLDLEQLDADEPIVGAVRPAGQAVPLGPLARQRGVGPAQVRAILGVVGQQDLRGVAVDGPLLGPLGLAVVAEIGVGLGQRAPGGPAGQDQGVGQSPAPTRPMAARARVIAVGHVGVVGRRHDHGAGPALGEPVDDLVDVGAGRLIAGRSGRRRGPSRPPRRPGRCTRGGTRPRGPMTFFWSLSQGAATFRSPAKTRTSITGRPRRTAYSCSRQAAVIAPSSACGQSITSGRFGPSAWRSDSRTSTSWPCLPWPRPSGAGDRIRAASRRTRRRDGSAHGGFGSFREMHILTAALNMPFQAGPHGTGPGGSRSRAV